MIKITTDRLIIRDHIESDLEVMHELLSNKQTIQIVYKCKHCNQTIRTQMFTIVYK